MSLMMAWKSPPRAPHSFSAVSIAAAAPGRAAPPGEASSGPGSAAGGGGGVGAARRGQERHRLRGHPPGSAGPDGGGTERNGWENGERISEPGAAAERGGEGRDLRRHMRCPGSGGGRGGWVGLGMLRFGEGGRGGEKRGGWQTEHPRDAGGFGAASGLVELGTRFRGMLGVAGTGETRGCPKGSAEGFGAALQSSCRGAVSSGAKDGGRWGWRCLGGTKDWGCRRSHPELLGGLGMQLLGVQCWAS